MKTKFAYRHLIKELAISDFSLRYKNSMLGYLWSLIKPIAMFGTLYVVFSIWIRFDVEHYPLFLLLGIILWNYLAEATITGMNSLLTKASLIQKISFPREMIVIASNITTLLTLFLNLTIFFIFVIIVRPEFWNTFHSSILIFPLYVLELFLLATGLSLFLSSFYLKFRDLSHIWEITLTIGFWLTPIVYSLSLIPPKYHQLLYLNPVARIIEDSRLALISFQIPTMRHLLFTLITVMIIFGIGWYTFKKRSPYFAEDI